MSEAEKKFLKSKAEVFKALGHPTRLLIMDRLARGEACVCEFVGEAGADFSTVSAHLAVLQKAGLVSGDKRGREVYYTCLAPCIYDFMPCIEMVIKQRLAATLEMLQTQEAENGNQSVRPQLQEVQDNRGPCA